MLLRFIALGTSATFPTPLRNHPSFFLEYKGTGILFDCGEGTQRQIRKAGIKPSRIKYVLITHWHGDHVLGLPGLLFLLANSEYKEKLTIFVPERCDKKLEKIIESFDIPVEKINYEIKTIKEGIIVEEKEFYIEAIELNHTVKCFGFVFKQKDYYRYDKQKLKEYGLEGKHRLLDKLKERGEIEYKGRKIRLEEVAYKKIGFKFSYITDTIFEEKIINFVRNSDILLIESLTFYDPELAKEHSHLDFTQALEIFKKSDSNIMLITHVSQRYEDELEKIKEELKKEKRIFLIRDFDEFVYEKNQIRLKIWGEEFVFNRDEKTGKIQI